MARAINSLELFTFGPISLPRVSRDIVGERVNLTWLNAISS